MMSNLGQVAEAYYDKDVTSSEVQKNEVIAVLGYGIQGRAQASNLADSGFKVIVGLRKDGKFMGSGESRRAQGDGSF